MCIKASAGSRSLYWLRPFGCPFDCINFSFVLASSCVVCNACRMPVETRVSPVTECSLKVPAVELTGAVGRPRMCSLTERPQAISARLGQTFVDSVSPPSGACRFSSVAHCSLSAEYGNFSAAHRFVGLFICIYYFALSSLFRLLLSVSAVNMLIAEYCLFTRVDLNSKFY